MENDDTELITIHTEGGGTRLLKKDLWPNLIVQDPGDIMHAEEKVDLSNFQLTEEVAEQLPDKGPPTSQLTDIGEVAQEFYSEGEDDWYMVSTQRNSKQRFYPTVATKKSSRVMGGSANSERGIPDLSDSPPL